MFPKQGLQQQDVGAQILSSSPLLPRRDSQSFSRAQRRPFFTAFLPPLSTSPIPQCGAASPARHFIPCSVSCRTASHLFNNKGSTTCCSATAKAAKFYLFTAVTLGCRYAPHAGSCCCRLVGRPQQPTSTVVTAVERPVHRPRCRGRRSINGQQVTQACKALVV